MAALDIHVVGLDCLVDDDGGGERVMGTDSNVVGQGLKEGGIYLGEGFPSGGKASLLFPLPQ